MLWEKHPHGNVLLVGHNYGISDLVNYFCGTDIELRTGQYVRISFNTSNWAEVFQDTGSIVEMYRPEV
jgi:phosphohistidine phosphatase SixA